jgi:hypothetical protein
VGSTLTNTPVGSATFKNKYKNKKTPIKTSKNSLKMNKSKSHAIKTFYSSKNNTLNVTSKKSRRPKSRGMNFFNEEVSVFKTK